MRRTAAVLLALLCLLAPSLHAQPVPEAPIPPALLSAKTVFLSNAGADSGLFPEPFSGRPSRAYDQMYAALMQWGHFTLVTDPAQADLVLELQLQAPNGPQNADKSKGASDPLPMFKLTACQRSTHIILWTVTESIDAAFRQKSHDSNFDQALVTLLSDFKSVVERPLPSPPAGRSGPAPKKP